MRHLFLDEKEYERGGTRFRSYIALTERHVWKQEDMFLTSAGRWLHFKEWPVTARAASRYRARADGDTPSRDSLELASGYVARNETFEKRLHTL